MAQHSSIYGRFQADYINGCSPLEVIITETDTFPPETVRQYDFDGDGVFTGFEPDEEVSFIYNSPGDYRIVQVINVDISPKTDTLSLTVNASSDPEFTIFACANNFARIEIAPDQYDRHRIIYSSNDSITIDQGVIPPPYEFPAGTHTVAVKGLFEAGKENCGQATRTFTTVEALVAASLNTVSVTAQDDESGSVRISYQLNPGIKYQLEKAEDLPGGFNEVITLNTGSTSYTIDSIDTENITHIFRISAYDACLEAFIYSDTISSIRLQATAENGQNRVSWESFPLNFDRYQLYRDSQLLGTIESETRRTFIDHAVSCFTEYCYSVLYHDRAGGISYSDTVCVEAFRIFFPPPVKNTTASVADNDVSLSWTPVEDIEATSYFVQRRIDDDIYATLDTVSLPQYLDTDVDVNDQPYCYRISYLDECLNRSNLGDLACTIHLKIENNRIIRWNDYTGWLNGVNRYLVEVYDDQRVLQEEISMSTDNVYEIENYIKTQINEYRIKAESNDQPPQAAFSNYVLKQIESVLWFPDAFTPDGDGLNDVFRPEGTLMEEFSLKIYSRYGNLIFETTDQDAGWDGRVEGKEMPFNTYIYKTEALDHLGKAYNLTGKVLLIRE